MRRASVQRVTPGTPIGQSVFNQRGDLLLAAGTPLTERYLELLQARGTTTVVVDDPDSTGIQIEDPLSERVRTLAMATVGKVYKAVETAAAGLRELSPETLVAGLRSGEFRREVERLLPEQMLYEIIDQIFEEVCDLPMLSGLTAIKTYDSYTFSHSIEMAVAAIHLGRKVRLNQGSLKRLARGCIVHDIGKIFVREDVLNKAGKLDAAEQAEMQKHPQLGFELLQTVHNADVLVNHVAFQHHERQDGKGYPRGLTGHNRLERSDLRDPKRILLIAEIAAVADIYDALASDRPYRAGLAPEKVISILGDLAGAHLNRDLVAAFLSAVPSFPAGMPVRIVDGKLRGCEGLVARVDPGNKDRPVVRILRNPFGKQVRPFEIDLAKEPSIVLASILDAEPPGVE